MALVFWVGLFCSGFELCRTCWAVLDVVVLPFVAPFLACIVLQLLSSVWSLFRVVFCDCPFCFFSLCEVVIVSSVVVNLSVHYVLFKGIVENGFWSYVCLHTTNIGAAPAI